MYVDNGFSQHVILTNITVTQEPKGEIIYDIINDGMDSDMQKIKEGK